MSIPVALDDLAETLAGYPWGYLVTVGPDLRAHVLAVPSTFADGVFVLSTGRSSRANAALRPEVTLVFPSPEPGAFSLVVDGNAEVRDAHVAVRPTHAILHRPALPG